MSGEAHTEAEWEEIGKQQREDQYRREAENDLKWKWLGIGIALTVVIATLAGLTH